MSNITKIRGERPASAMKLKFSAATFLLHLCSFHTFAEECKATYSIKALQEAKADAKINSENWIRYCVAQCLDLTNFTDPDSCKFNPVSGLQAGACVAPFKPNPKTNKKLLCAADNLHNPHSKFNLTKLIKSGLCTHIAPGPFFNYHKGNGSIELLEGMEKMYQDDFKIAAEFKVKILLWVGEFYGNTFQTDNFSKIAATEPSRINFAERMADFISKHNLAGISLNWLAPGCIKLDCLKGSKADKSNYPKLLLELRKVLKPDMEIMITMPYSSDWWGGYDFEKLFPLVDYFQIQTYCYIWHEYPATGHTTNLASIKKTMDYLKKYVSKVLIGINSRIEVFKLANKQEYKSGAKMLSHQGGKTSINQICNRVRNSKTSVSNPVAQTNRTDSKLFCKEDPYNQLGEYVCEVYNSTDVFVVKENDKGNYAAFETNWFSYEDKDSMSRKVDLMNSVGAPGLYLSAVNYDDANNACGCVGDFALTRTIAELLRANDGCSMKPCF